MESEHRIRSSLRSEINSLKRQISELQKQKSKLTEEEESKLEEMKTYQAKLEAEYKEITGLSVSGSVRTRSKRTSSASGLLIKKFIIAFASLVSIVGIYSILTGLTRENSFLSVFGLITDSNRVATETNFIDNLGMIYPGLLILFGLGIVSTIVGFLLKPRRFFLFLDSLGTLIILNWFIYAWVAYAFGVLDKNAVIWTLKEGVLFFLIYTIIVAILVVVSAYLSKSIVFGIFSLLEGGLILTLGILLFVTNSTVLENLAFVYIGFMIYFILRTVKIFLMRISEDQDKQ